MDSKTPHHPLSAFKAYSCISRRLLTLTLSLFYCQKMTSQERRSDSIPVLSPSSTVFSGEAIINIGDDSKGKGKSQDSKSKPHACHKNRLLTNVRALGEEISPLEAFEILAGARASHQDS